MAPPQSDNEKAYQAGWRKRNKDKIAAWRERDKDKIAAYRTDYRERNREQVLEKGRESERKRRQAAKAEQGKRRAAVQRAKAYAAANPGKVAQNKRDWAARYPEKMKQARRDYVQRNRAAVQQRTDAWRLANPEKAGRPNTERDRDALASYTAQRRADPDKYAHDLEVNRDRRRLLRQLTSQGLPPPLHTKVSAAQRRANGAAAREFFTRTRTAIERRNLVRTEDGPPTAKELHAAARDRQRVRNREEIQKRTRLYLARHGERIRREIELDSHARQLGGASPLNIDLELVRRVRLFTDRENRPVLSPAPVRDTRTPATRGNNSPTQPRQRDTDRSH